MQEKEKLNQYINTTIFKTHTKKNGRPKKKKIKKTVELTKFVFKCKGFFTKKTSLHALKIINF